MNTETFFQQFELLADAPNGIAKLRELILQLAVQGKLVPQNPDDEPAAVLLERIKDEKERLVKEGKIKKSKKLPDVKPDEIPFELPDSWKWCRWDNVVMKIGDVDHKMPQEEINGIPYISPRDFTEGGGINFSEAKKISKPDFLRLSQKIQPQRNDIIFPRYGTIGVNRYVSTDMDFLASYSCAVIKNLKNFIAPKYSYYYSISLLVKREIAIYTNKTTQANVGVKSIQNFIFPLPPLAEQHRIVEKVDRLMELCDKLETQKQQQHTKTLQLGTVATSRLTAAKTPEAFKQHWQNISNNFDLIYSTPENIKQLRQTILQLAVMGKLVPQNPDDEPASILLAKIKTEKEKLIKEGKIKKSKKLKAIASDEIPYDLPKGWELERALSLCNFILDGDHNPPQRISKGIPHITAKNIINNQINFEGCTYISEKDFERIRKRYYPQINDVILTCAGTLGRTAIINKRSIFSADRNIAIFRLFSEYCHPRYLKIVLDSPNSQKKIDNANGNTAQKHIYLKQIRDLVIPLPPLAEQHRIVAKVNQLMSYCDELEAKLTQSLKDKEKLMDTAVYQLLTA